MTEHNFIPVPSVTVYSKPSCVQCTAVKRHLDREGILYTAVDVTEDAAAMDHVKGLGYLQVPVVEFEDTHFYGYNPLELAKLPH